MSKTDWVNDPLEWIEADGLGGFAMGTASGLRTRRYHGLLTPAVAPPTGRMVLVAGIEAWLELADDTRIELSTHRYAPDVLHPSGVTRLKSFTTEPWPTWTYEEAGITIEHGLFVTRGVGDVVVYWRLLGSTPAVLRARPLLAGRDYHGTIREGLGFDFNPVVVGANVSFRPRPGVPGISLLTNGRYDHEPTWFQQFHYIVEQARGLDDREDLASPGILSFNLSPGARAVMVLRAGDAPYANAEALVELYESRERARRSEASRPLRVSEDYLVQRGPGLSLVAGYPWFTDWGRDTFIAMRGLCLTSGRLEEASRILSAWAPAVSEGMLPNRFPDAGDVPEFNAVDASLWFVLVVGELVERLAKLQGGIPEAWLRAVAAILDGYAAGTRFGIRVDGDGLLAAGVPGQQLTWMDAKVGDWVITPRIGKPVELQALWVNALSQAEKLLPERADELGRWKRQALESFQRRFTVKDGRMPDVVDVDHRPGTQDDALRPNVIWAVGGLPFALVEGEPARSVMDEVEAELVVPGALRTLEPSHPEYRAHYRGNPLERDSAYHQGTAWPWLLGAFVQAWIRTRRPDETKGDQHLVEARTRFLEPLEALVKKNGNTGHLPEVLDGDPPHNPGGTPFQAWSVGEWLRIREMLLGAP